jgi:hypothetical protein
MAGRAAQELQILPCVNAPELVVQSVARRELLEADLLAHVANCFARGPQSFGTLRVRSIGPMIIEYWVIDEECVVVHQRLGAHMGCRPANAPTPNPAAQSAMNDRSRNGRAVRKRAVEVRG